MGEFVNSFNTCWTTRHDLDEILDWAGDKDLEGFELKTPTATTPLSTEYDRKTGKLHDMWRVHSVAIVQRPNGWPLTIAAHDSDLSA